MKEFICPLCGARKKCRPLDGAEDGFQGYYCERFGSGFYLADEIVSMEDGSEQKERLLDMAATYLIRRRGDNAGPAAHFFLSDGKAGCNAADGVDLSYYMMQYPVKFMDKSQQVLMNLSCLFPNFGDVIGLTYSDRHAIFEHSSNNANTPGILTLLMDLGYLKPERNGETYIITAEGWKKIDELQRGAQELKQGFISMRFCAETAGIRDAFRRAISQSGYNACVIDEKEHNNQIVPEIFYEIERSKFLVMDITYPNYGAYYEAGYAQALKKQVIICCRQAEFDSAAKRPHFDILQKSMIVWENEADLIKRLTRRIEATVS